MNYKVRLKQFLQSLSFRFSAALLIIVVLLLIGLNLFTYRAPRNILYREIEAELLRRATELSASLANAEALDTESIRRAVEVLETEEAFRVIVTDQWGTTLYRSAGAEDRAPKNVITDMILALSGDTAYSFEYSGDAYDYDLAVPITNNGRRLGVVCLYFHDTARGRTFDLTVNNLQKITIALGLFSALAIYLVTRSFSRRVRDLSRVMRKVREGDYEQRVNPTGNDEITSLSSEFNQLMDRLQQTVVRRRFVADASHELKTPLSIIILMADSILQGEDMPPATAKEFLGDIRDEAVRLKQITEKLLDLTRLDSKRGTPCSDTAVDVKAVTESAVRLLSTLADESGVSLRMEMPEPNYLSSVPEDAIYRVVFNLTENAIKYNRPGGTATLILNAEENGVCLTVEDTGIGIPAADIPQIFTRFYRVDTHRSRGSGGSGLGLSIVRDTLKKCGGRIEVESEENKGSRFLAFFPR